MNAALATTTGFKNSFAAASVFFKQPWLKAFCTQQFEKFLERGLPIKKDEWWKYTNVSYLEKMNFTFPTIPDAESNTPAKHIDSAILLAFKNGHFSPEMSNLDLLPPEIILSPLSLALQKHENLIKPYLLKELDGQRHPFTYLNSALMVEGTFLQIPKNCILSSPIHLLFLNTRQNNFISCPRNIIIAHENSQVKIIEEHTANQAENYFTNVVTELYVDTHAQLNYYKLQNEHCTATHIANIRVQQKEDSYVKTFFSDYGSRLAREDLTINLHEPRAVCDMTGFYFLEQDEQQVDNHIYVDHAATHCSSSILYKGILDKKSQAIFNGKVYAHSSAKQTVAQQVNHNLLLSPTAEINTKPELEIYTDDVKCTHGATVGQLNKDALFYLRARGIDKEEALKILVQAFIEEIMHKIADPFIRDYMWQRVKKYAYL